MNGGAVSPTASGDGGAAIARAYEAAIPYHPGVRKGVIPHDADRPHPDHEAMAVDTLDLGLPHLNVVDTIGRGGFSVVYKAIDTKLNRPVAVKVLTGIADKAGLERFDQECQIHGPLSNHPNIVTIHDAGFTPTGSPFLVMEYLDGGSLTDFLEANGRLAWQKADRVDGPGLRRGRHRPPDGRAPP